MKGVGAAGKMFGSIFGGIKAARAMRQNKKMLQGEQRENQSWYDKNYNADSTQRADAQAILTQTAEAIKNRNRQAAGAQAVMGGTEESVAATKAANAQAMSDAASQIAIAGEQRKDAIENQYMQRKAGINEQLRALNKEKAQNISSAIKGVGDAFSEMGVAFSPQPQQQG